MLEDIQEQMQADILYSNIYLDAFHVVVINQRTALVWGRENSI